MAGAELWVFLSPSRLFCCVGTDKNLTNVGTDHHHYLTASLSSPACLPELELGVRQANDGLAEGLRGSVAARREGGEKGGGAVVRWWASSASQTHIIDLLIG